MRTALGVVVAMVIAVCATAEDGTVQAVEAPSMEQMQAQVKRLQDQIGDLRKDVARKDNLIARLRARIVGDNGTTPQKSVALPSWRAMIEAPRQELRDWPESVIGKTMTYSGIVSLVSGRKVTIVEFGPVIPGRAGVLDGMLVIDFFCAQPARIATGQRFTGHGVIANATASVFEDVADIGGRPVGPNITVTLTDVELK